MFEGLLGAATQMAQTAPAWVHPMSMGHTPWSSSGSIMQPDHLSPFLQSLQLGGSIMNSLTQQANQQMGLSPDISAAIGLQREQLQSENDRFNQIFGVLSNELGAGGGGGGGGGARKKKNPQERTAGPTLGQTFESGQRRANPMLQALQG